MNDREPSITVQLGSCCSSTEEGNTVCAVPQNGQTATCRCASTEVEKPNPTASKAMEHPIRTGLLVGVACITSPCCTPLIIPLVIALFAGTPLAWWISQNVGWIYGGLTLISILSFAMVFRRMGKRSPSKPTSIYPNVIPVIPPVESTHSHAN